jgi:hypothetical protein
MGSTVPDDGEGDEDEDGWGAATTAWFSDNIWFNKFWKVSMLGLVVAEAVAAAVVVAGMADVLAAEGGCCRLPPVIVVFVVPAVSEVLRRTSSEREWCRWPTKLALRARVPVVDGWRCLLLLKAIGRFPLSYDSLVDLFFIGVDHLNG